MRYLPTVLLLLWPFSGLCAPLRGAGHCNAVIEMAETLTVGPSSVTIGMLASEDVDFYVSYGRGENLLTEETSVVNGTGGERVNLVLSGLDPDTEYYYRVHCKRSESPADHIWYKRKKHSFHTQRSHGASFNFAVLGDSHASRMVGSPSFYPELHQTLQNVLTRDNDFAIVGGDNAMCDSASGSPVRWFSGEFFQGYGTMRACQIQYLGAIYSYRAIAADLPLFYMLGNHESEICTDEDDYYWSEPGDKSCEHWRDARASILVNLADLWEGEQYGRYYAFTWGGVRFIVLDDLSFIPGGLLPTTAEEKTFGVEQLAFLEEAMDPTARTHFVFSHASAGGFKISATWWYGRAGLATTDGSRTANYVGDEGVVQRLLSQYAPSVRFTFHDHWFHHYLKLNQDGSSSGVYHVQNGRHGGTGAAWTSCNYTGDPLCKAYIDGQDGNGDGIPDHCLSTIPFCISYFGGQADSDPRNATKEIGYTQVGISPGSVTVEYIKSDSSDPEVNNTAIAGFTFPL